MAIPAKNTQTKKKWPRYAFVAALAMLLIAGALYLWMYISIDREFFPVSEYYGAHYEELFALSAPESDMKKELTAEGKAAMSFIGTEEECEAYGLLSRYCTAREAFPQAQRVETEFKVLAGKTEGTKGYLWVAYIQEVYDGEGQLITASGNSDRRILARWTAEKIDGCWTVTEILEQP